MQIDVHHPGPVESHHFKLSRKQDKTPSTAVQVSGLHALVSREGLGPANS